MSTADHFMQAPHIVHTATAAAVEPVTINASPEFLMYSVLAVVVASAIFGISGYFVGKRGLTGTQSDLSNVVTAVKKVPSEVSTAATEVKTVI